MRKKNMQTCRDKQIPSSKWLEYMSKQLKFGFHLIRQFWQRF